MYPPSLLHIRISCFALALSIVLPSVVRADPTDDFIKAQMKRQNIPGLSLVVIKNGEVVKVEGYGFADVRLQVPATPDTVYKIASVSKQFIATGIMLLVQEDRLDLNDRISRYLDDTPKTWKDIRIRHLLTHTSGIVREAPGYDPSSIRSDADVVKAAYSAPLRFSPGQKWEYCNVGYFALAEIIRKVSGRPWTDYLSEKVFKPSGMETTHPTNTTVDLPNRARGYSNDDKLLDANDWPALRPSGAFLSTVRDLAKWDAVLDTGTLLSKSTRRKMWTPVKLNDGAARPYGLGWELSSIAGRKTVHHSGGMPGFRAMFARFVEDGLTVIALMNLDDVDRAAIVSGVAKFYLPSR